MMRARRADPFSFYGLAGCEAGEGSRRTPLLTGGELVGMWREALGAER